MSSFIANNIFILWIFCICSHIIDRKYNYTKQILSTHIHDCFLVELVIYMTLSKGRYPSKSGDNIYCNIITVDSLMIACLVYHCTMLSSNIQMTERVISSSPLTDSLGKTQRLWNNQKDSWKTKIQNMYACWGTLWEI